MMEILQNLFGNNQCSFNEALIEFAIIGTGFFLLGTIFRALFRKRNYKKAYKELEREERVLRLDKRSLTSEVNKQKERIYQLERDLRALRKKA